ncbi:MAG TPA: DMT family transporter [Kofleriaceae bacterium]|nr:DMT family transporter [Kofleriaceae bacterium]
MPVRRVAAASGRLRAVPSSRLSPFGLVLLAIVTLGWGFTWPINKLVVDEIPPLTFRAVALVGGGAMLLVVARAGGQSLRLPVRYWGRLLALAAFNIVGWNVLVIYGIALLPSGRAALLGYTFPLWSTLLSIWLLAEPLTLQRGVSVALGMGGVAVLLGGDFARMAGAMTGVALTLGAAISWALGVVLLKRIVLPLQTVALTAWMMLAGGVPILIAAIVLEHDRWQPVSTGAVLGLLYSLFIALMLCYWAWNRLVLMEPVSVSSVSSLATPVIGVASGMWMLGEPLTWREIAAGAFILGALALALDPREGTREATRDGTRERSRVGR